MTLQLNMKALREVFHRSSRLPPIDKTPGAVEQFSELEYDPKGERGWRNYFQRPDIQRFLVRTDSTGRYNGEQLTCATPASEKSYMTLDVSSMPYLWVGVVR